MCRNKNTHFGWRQMKIGTKEGHEIIFFPFQKRVLSPGMVKNSESKEKKAVRTLFSPPPFFLGS
jgi:hypothetical protein